MEVNTDMIIGTAKLSKTIDEMCIENYNIPEIILMENAATSASKRILDIAKSDPKPSFTILCGSGNNGGDGLAIARKLKIAGYEVYPVFIGKEDKVSSSTKINLDMIKSMNLDMLEFGPDMYHLSDVELTSRLEKSDYLIDCIFGVGLNRVLDLPYLGMIGMINRSKDLHGFKVISIDVPSGMDATSGMTMGDSIEADYTVTLEYFKSGFLNYAALDSIGQVFVEPIGIPEEALKKCLTNADEYKARFITLEDIKNRLLVRSSNANKTDLGRVLIYGGSKGYYGAGYLSARAATKTGSGLVTLVCDQDGMNVNAPRLCEEMTCLNTDRDRLDSLILKADAIGFGSGKANRELAEKELTCLIEDIDRLYGVDSSMDVSSDCDKTSAKKPSLVIDAGGLDVFEPNMAKDLNVILTPHSGEFARMIGKNPGEVNENRLDLAVDYAKKYGLVLVLKGKNTIITDGKKTYVNTTGNQAMANGGMGDALTGIITSMCGQGYEVFDAALVGVYLHGLVGDEIYKEKYTVNAGDLIKMIPKVTKILYNV